MMAQIAILKKYFGRDLVCKNPSTIPIANNGSAMRPIARIQSGLSNKYKPA